MKKLLLSVTLLIICYSLATAQPAKKRQYQAKLYDFVGKVDIKICSEDIIEYSLEICNDAGNSIFKQEGFAIIPYLKEQKSYGSEYIERGNGELVSTEQYFELCNCKKWLTIKVAKDFSLVKIDCPETLINEIFGKKVNSNLSKQSLGNFILKN